MKYGEVFYTTRYGSAWYWDTKLIKCRFRIDPVPGRGKHIPYRVYLRKMRTTQERRMSLVYPEYTRGKRTMKNLPDYYDDQYRADLYDRSWKRVKKRKQWM